ncbi:MAG: hypothetical protein ACFBSF_11225 [Leptolyngbyaceae cyanobacterium]
MVRTTQGKLHVFAASFASREEACLYTEEQWEPEPGDDVSDDEYAAWENRNPTWGLADDLNIDLDPDFIETIDGDECYDYLRGYLVNTTDLDTVRQAAGDANTLVLIFPNALHDRSVMLASTSQMTYCGAFDFQWA